MLGLKIVEHAVRQVWDNRHEALLLTLFPYGISVVIGVLFPTVDYEFDPTGAAELPSGGAVLGAIVAAVVSVLVSLWIVVLWHRLVLVGDRPTGWIPRWHGGRMASYFGRGLLIALLVFAVMVPIGLILGGVMIGAGGAGAILVTLVMVAVGTAVFYRLSPILPAAAVDRKMTFREALEHTSGQTGTILVMMVIVTLGTLVLQAPLLVLGEPSGTLVVVYSAVIGWFVTLIGASVLTTIYSHFVEGKPLD